MRRFACRERATVLSLPFQREARRGAEASPYSCKTAAGRVPGGREIRYLEAACLAFGIGKSELVRRLIRASVDIGPALSLEEGKETGTIGKELRAIGRNIAQM